MRTTLLLLVLFAGSALASQTVWKWVDEKGVTHFSDRSVPGATKVEVSSGNSAAPPESSDDATQNGTSPAAVALYQDFEIWQPSDDETFVNTGGVVAVNVRLNPALKPGHSVYLYLDGTLIDGYPGNALSFELHDVVRGTHTLIAVVNDDTNGGKRVQETPSVRFNVRQESVQAQPPVGPSLRPPPKPRPTRSSKLSMTQPSYAALNGARLPIDPATNKPVVAKPAPAKPPTPKGS